MSHNVSELKPLHGPFIPDPGWEQKGLTTHSPPKVLYLEKTHRTRPKPLYVQLPCGACNGRGIVDGCDECNNKGTVDAEREWKMHPLTKEPLYPKNYAEHYTHERLFFVESDGQGQQVLIDWHPPSEEEVAAQARDAAVDRMIPEISDAFVDSGLSGADIAEALKQLVKMGKAAAPVAPVAAPEAPMAEPVAGPTSAELVTPVVPVVAPAVPEPVVEPTPADPTVESVLPKLPEPELATAGAGVTADDPPNEEL